MNNQTQNLFANWDENARQTTAWNFNLVNYNYI